MPGKAVSSKVAADKEIHVAIHDHDELRMSILESARLSVAILQRERKLEELRKQKVEAFREMKGVIEEIMNLNLKLEKVMPKIKMSRAAVKKELRDDVKIVEQPAERPVPHMHSRIDELEQELADIEKRMSSLK